MRVSSTYGNYTNALYSWQQDLQSAQSNQNGTTAAANTGTNAAKKSTTSTQQSVYQGSSTVSSLVEITKYAMDAMGVGSNERTTFSQIMAYRKQLEKDYSATLKTAFAAAGIPEDVSFRLQQDDNGKLQVVSDGEQQAAIQKVFDDNPELTKQYERIQMLANLETARKSLGVDPNEMRKRIQIESIATWWQNTDTSANSLGVFSGGNMSMYSGLNVTA